MRTLQSLATTVFLGAMAMAWCLTHAHGEAKELPELNRKVLQFAEENLGKQVAKGECWILAAEALTRAGAQRPGTNGVPIYVFGRKLRADETILPGDVVQFEKAKFVQKIKMQTFTKTFPHHTAIVAKVEGKNITLLHQNYGGKRTVTTEKINLDAHVEGIVEFFRPQLKKK
jgi:hypothetical protein